MEVSKIQIADLLVGVGLEERLADVRPLRDEMLQSISKEADDVAGRSSSKGEACVSLDVEELCQGVVLEDEVGSVRERRHDVVCPCWEGALVLPLRHFQCD